MPLGPAVDRFPIGDARRSSHDLELVLLGQPFQHAAQVQLAQASHHRLVGADRVFDAQARVFRSQFLQYLPEALLVAPARRLDCQAVDRRGEVERDQVDVAVLRSVMQHSIKVDLVDFCRGADIARAGLLDIHVLLALQHQQVGDPERLAPVTDIELAIAPDRTLVDAKHSHLADVGVYDDLEDVGQHLLVGNRFGAHDFLAAAGIAVKERRVAFHGTGQEPDEHVEQFRDAGAVDRRREADRHQMTFAQRPLEGLVQLLGVDGLALLQVKLHQGRVDLDHLIDQRSVHSLHRQEIGVAGRVEEAVHHLAATLRRQVDGQASRTEGLLDLRQKPRKVDLFAIDTVHDDHSAELALRRPCHHAPGGHFDAGLRIDDDSGSLHSGQGTDRKPGKIRITGRIQQIDVCIPVVQVGDGGVQRVVIFAFERIEIADSGAALHATGRVERAALVQQCFGKRCLAAPGMPDQGDSTDGIGAVAHGRPRPVVDVRPLLAKMNPCAIRGSRTVRDETATKNRVQPDSRTFQNSRGLGAENVALIGFALKRHPW